MKVKYYMVNNSAELLDKLECYLCKENISYVRIENEIHFADNILRFFDKKKSPVLVGDAVTKNFNIISLLPNIHGVEINVENNFKKSILLNKSNLEMEEISNSKQKTRKINDYKSESHNVNNILKRNIR